MEQVDNRLLVRCPSLIALTEFQDFLTFVRVTFERERGRYYPVETPEPCCANSSPRARSKK